MYWLKLNEFELKNVNSWACNSSYIIQMNLIDFIFNHIVIEIINHKIYLGITEFLCKFSEKYWDTIYQMIPTLWYHGIPNFLTPEP